MSWFSCCCCLCSAKEPPPLDSEKVPYRDLWSSYYCRTKRIAFYEDSLKGICFLFIISRKIINFWY